MDSAAIKAPAGKDLFGHPRGLAYLTLSESSERFAFYGMQALLVLYMTHYLLQPGHVEHVAGFGPFRAMIESAYGPLTPAALASVIFGFYAGGVYLTPLAGGFIADRWLGRTTTVALGAILMAVGYFLMAFEVSFLAALALILIGVGGFKGNIASQVGELYSVEDKRRDDAFLIFLLGINIAVIIAPLVCGTLGQKVAWRWGFLAAGVAMVVGIVIYLAGKAYLPHEAAREAKAEAKAAAPKLTRRDWISVALLVALLPILAVGIVGNQQIFNAYLIWGDANYQLKFFGEEMPVTWLLSLDAFISTGMITAIIAFWRFYARIAKEPDEIVKLVIGIAVSAGAPLVLAAASAYQQATGHKVSLEWGVAFHVINDIGFAMVFPVGLALYSRASPKGLGGLMIGVYYLHLFFSNMLVGWLGSLLEKMGAAPFWTLHAILGGAAAGALLLFAIFFRKYLAPTEETLTPPIKS